MSQPIRGNGGHFVFDRPEKHKLGRGRRDLPSCQIAYNSAFSALRREVENVSANQRQGWSSCFSDRPANHKRGRVR